MSNVIEIILDDIRVELSAEFDKNFERKGFFGNKWDKVKKDPNIGSLMLRTSALRNSIQSSRQGFKLVWRSDVPYASVHNEGGQAGRNLSATIPQRQFIGTSDETEAIIGDIVNEHLPNGVNEYLDDLFNQIDNG